MATVQITNEYERGKFAECIANVEPYEYNGRTIDDSAPPTSLLQGRTVKVNPTVLAWREN